MAIQPIDLQTLYTQLEKVSKNVVQQSTGAQIQSSLLHDKKIEKEQQKSKTVEQTKTSDEGLMSVKQRQNQNEDNQSQSKEKKESNEEVVQGTIPQQEIIKDPSLGQHLDITG